MKLGRKRDIENRSQKSLTEKKRFLEVPAGLRKFHLRGAPSPFFASLVKIEIKIIKAIVGILKVA
jgi:hypothetical protein